MADPLTYVLDTFGGPFQKLADELARRHPEARFSVQSLPSGAATAFQGHMLYVQCFWPGRGPDDADGVLLEIELCHLTTTPRVNAGVCWDHGPVEAEFAKEWSSSDDWPEAIPANLERLTARVPELMDEFRRVVARGYPDKPSKAELHSGPPALDDDSV